MGFPPHLTHRPIQIFHCPYRLQPMPTEHKLNSLLGIHLPASRSNARPNTSHKTTFSLEHKIFTHASFYSLNYLMLIFTAPPILTCASVLFAGDCFYLTLGPVRRLPSRSPHILFSLHSPLGANFVVPRGAHPAPKPPGLLSWRSYHKWFYGTSIVNLATSFLQSLPQLIPLISNCHFLTFLVSLLRMQTLCHSFPFFNTKSVKRRRIFSFVRTLPQWDVSMRIFSLCSPLSNRQQCFVKLNPFSQQDA